MATVTQLKVGGAWKDIPDIKIKESATWKQVVDGLIKISGDWKHFYQYGGGPVTEITNPTEVSVIDRDDVVSIQVDASDDDGIERVNFYVKGPTDPGYTFLGDDFSEPFAKNWQPGEAGEWSIKVEAIDGVGIKGYDYVTVVVLEPGNTPPEATIDSPADSASFTAGESVNIVVTATDADGTVSMVKYYADGAYIGSQSVGVSDVFTLAWVAVADVTELSVKAIDNQAGESTEESISITVADAPVAPTVTITSPSEGAEHNEGDPATIGFNFSDADDDAEEYSIYVNGVEIVGWTALTSPGGSGSQTRVISPAGSGNMQVVVLCKDSGDRVSPAQVVNLVYNAANAAPSATWVTPTNGVTMEPSSAITLQVLASDGDGSVAEVTAQIRGNGAGGNNYNSGILSLAYNGTSGYWELATALPAFSGVFSVIAFVKDNLGAIKKDTITLTTNAKPTIDALANKSINTGSGAIFTLVSHHNHVNFLANVSSDTHSISTSNLPAGTIVNTVQSGGEYTTTVTVPNTTPAGTYVMSLHINDSYWPTVTKNFILVITNVELAPTVTVFSVNNNNPKQGETFTFTFQANDPESKLKLFELQLYDANLDVWNLVTSVGVGGSGYLLNDYNWQPSVLHQTVGQRTYRIRAKDEANLYGISDSIVVTVKPDYQPTFSGSAAPVFADGVGGNLDFYVLNPDQDGDNITITATSTNATLNAACASITKTYEGANHRYACRIVIPTNLSVGLHTIKLNMSDGFNPLAVQDIVVKVNRAPSIFAGASTAPLTGVEGAPNTWLIPLTDDNGASDISDGTLTVSSGTKPDGVTLSIFTSDGGLSKALSIAWDGTEEAGDYVWGVRVSDIEGAASNEVVFTLTVSEPAPLALTFSGPTALTWRFANANSFSYVISVEHPNGGNITAVTHSSAPNLGISLVRKSYHNGSGWVDGDPPTPSASKRRISIMATPTYSAAINNNPHTVTVTATDANGGEHQYVTVITVTP